MMNLKLMKYAVVLLASLAWLPLQAATPMQMTDVGTAYDLSHIISYVVAGVMIAVFLLIFFTFVIVFREQDVSAEIKRQTSRLSTVMLSGRIRVWTYDVATRRYSVLSSSGEADAEYNPVDFSLFFDRDDFEVLRSAVFELCDGKRMSQTVKMRSRTDNPEEQRHYEVKISIFRRDPQGRTVTVLGMQRDVTDDYRKQTKVNELLMRYHTVFNSSIVDMIYYDRNGVLADINDKACESFKIADRSQLLAGHYQLSDNPLFNYIDIHHVHHTHATAMTNLDDYHGHTEGDMALRGKLYYESVVSPIRDRQGQLEGIYMTGRNVTEMVESYHRQQEGSHLLQQATANIQEYVNDINYALQVTGVWLVNYYPKRHALEMSTDLNSKKYTFSQLRCIRVATPRYRRMVSSLLNRMDHHIAHAMSETIETVFRDERGRAINYHVSVVPVYDHEHQIDHYFGMLRNQTDIVETEHRLAIETRKAQETEQLKQSFLTNMSYEIRTPLNTVVGFAELFESEHDEADEPIFVEEIRRNTNSLLELINDILYLSRLDAGMVEYNKEFIDFAAIFESHCQMGWSAHGPEVRVIVENPYNHLVVNIDQQNLGQVIQKMCAFAASYTHEGTIRAKYEYRRGELNITIEDTGQGIDEQTLPHVFERFVRNRNNEQYGTGLALPIVQSMVQQMGGSIDLQSELGKGTTVWVTIPCESQTIDKKRDIL